MNYNQPSSKFTNILFLLGNKTRSPEDKYAQSLDECLGVLYSKIQDIEHFQVRDDESDDESKNKNKNKKKFSNFFYFFKGDRTMEQEIKQKQDPCSQK
ncbi:hypothetical protein M0812_11537 [Anaeramoeba flamelloides]|uniref:Uncharacterized protein n=1 Tax=Anaeramoeba flamelloides TaxID=1746091 RepID=A0AAV7ZYW1_9EUKA|nr:hypothetical protein M0812_11537 [Anaeramoeba flamelloides]